MCADIEVSRRPAHSLVLINFDDQLIRFSRVSNANIDCYENAENLKLKLSLKKQIWTGIQSSCDQLSVDKTQQPLSWGIPPMRKKVTKHDENEELLT